MITKLNKGFLFNLQNPKSQNSNSNQTNFINAKNKNIVKHP